MMMRGVLLAAVAAVAVLPVQAEQIRPTVLWHGMVRA